MRLDMVRCTARSCRARHVRGLCALALDVLLFWFAV